MIFFSEKEILIRNMNNSDVACIVNAEGEQSSPEKYLCRLKDQRTLNALL